MTTPPVFQRGHTYVVGAADGTSKAYRAVLVSEQSNLVAHFDFSAKATTALPVLTELDQLLEAHSARRVTFIPDPFALRVGTPSEAAERIATDRLSRVQAVLAFGEHGILTDSHLRQQAFRSVASMRSVHPARIAEALSLWYRRGMTRYAVIGDFHECGAPGDPRILGDKKVGRPRGLDHPGGPEAVAQGVNIAEHQREAIRLLATAALKSSKSHVLSIEKLWRQFTTLHQFVTIFDGHGNPRRMPIPDALFITREQFLFHIRPHLSTRDAQMRILGERRFLARHREALDTPNRRLFGPSAVYQIDWTPLPILLVSPIDRRTIVGQPFLYLVCDWYSGMIVGFTLSFEHPNQFTARAALFAAAMPKTLLAASCGVPISDSEWWATGFAGELISDGGEIRGKELDSVVLATGMSISTLPAYRGDLKGLVESLFGAHETKNLQDLPGALTNAHVKAHAPRTQPLLTIDDLRTILVRHIISHNAAPVGDRRLPVGVLTTGEMAMSRQELFLFGARTFGNGLQFRSIAELRRMLLVRKQCRVGPEGIRLFGLHYVSRRGLDQGQFLRRLGRKAPEVLVAINLENMSEVWLIHENSDEWEPLDLVAGCHEYAGMSLREIRMTRACRRVARSAVSERANVIQDGAHSSIEAVVRAAKKERTGLDALLAGASAPRLPAAPPVTPELPQATRRALPSLASMLNSALDDDDVDADESGGA